MNWLRIISSRFLVSGLLLGLLTACGDPESKSNTVPEASPIPTPAPTTIPQPTPNPDNRLPDLSKAVAVRLTNGAPNYTDLIAMAGFVELPLVGDPKIVLNLTTDRTSFSGHLLFGFEDGLGWWGAELPIVSTASTSSTRASDFIFTDPFPGPNYSGANPLLTMRVEMASITSDDSLFEGNIFYRVRASGELQCWQVRQCNQFGVCTTPPLDVLACKTYMNTANGQVKKLGTFRANRGTWIGQQ